MPASLLLALTLSGGAWAQPCGPQNSAISDVRHVEGAMFPEFFLGQEDHIRWGMVSSDEVEEGGWLDFLWESVKKIKIDGVVDRYFEVQRVEKAVKDGKNPGALNIPKSHYRLRNVAEMQDVIEQAGPNAGGLAAHSLRDANAWFYTLFGNDSGSFANMDMAQYRQIGAMQADQAASVLPQFEAETFRRSGDTATVRYGNMLPAEQRRDLFTFHSKYFAPNPHSDNGEDWER